MIYPIGGLILGVLFGAFRARQKGGNRLDMAQWAAGFGILFAIIGLFVLIFVERSYY